MDGSPPRSAIIDIRDREKEFKRIDDRTDALRKGFTILSLEYEYYTKDTKGHEKLLELKENIVYRFFSAIYHLQLMLQQHPLIAKRFTDHFIKNPRSFEKHAPKHREYSYAERQISALFDSVIYHLSSIYDYMSIFINFICIKDRDKTPKWTQMCQIARQSPQILRNEKMAEVILVLAQDLVSKLYKYRSRLIHEKADVCRILVIRTGSQFEPYFTCTETVRKLFGKYVQENDADYAITFMSMILIHETAQQVAVLTETLRRCIKQNAPSKDSMPLKLQEQIRPLLEEFDKHFKVKLD
jgi:hypothetical protein